MDVFLLAGQSNMAGRAQMPTTSLTPSSSQRIVINGHEILSFDQSQTWVPAHDPLHFDKPEKCGVGPGLPFAKLIAELDVIESNRKIGLIPCAVGGTSIQQWLPNNVSFVNDENMYREMDSDSIVTSMDGLFEHSIQATIMAMRTPFESSSKSKLLDDDDEQKCGVGGANNNATFDLDIQLKGILWHQGESDCDTEENAKHYLTAALTLLKLFRKHLNNDNLPIVVGGLPNFLRHNPNTDFLHFEIVNTALQSLPSRLHNVAFVSTHDLNHKGDFLHFDRVSCEIMGQRYAEKFAKLSGSLSNEELNTYIRFHRFSKFKNALRRQSVKAYEKTKGISFTTWLLGVTATVVGVYVYKQYYEKKHDTSRREHE